MAVLIPVEHTAKKKAGFSKIFWVWNVSLPMLPPEFYIAYFIKADIRLHII